MFCLTAPPPPPPFENERKTREKPFTSTVFSSFPPTSVTHTRATAASFFVAPSGLLHTLVIFTMVASVNPPLCSGGCDVMLVFTAVAL